MNRFDVARGLALLALLSATATADDPPRAVQALERAWPGHPEWLAMFVDILEGSQLGPTDGWFRKATAQARYDWDGTKTRLDRDGDGRISRGEFPGPDADFDRLDRDGDGSLSSPDFDFSPHALARSPGMMFFYRADADGNGKLTSAEIAAYFERADASGAGFLSLSDARELLDPPPSPSAPPEAGPAPSFWSAFGLAPSDPEEGPSRLTLIKGLFTQEIGSLQSGPKPGEIAPDFSLKPIHGGEVVSLSSLVGPRPVVLVFGNFTCGPFRSAAGDVEKLHQKYGDRATFVMVYVREAHPTDGWSMGSNDRVGVTFRQPRSQAERVEVAQTCAARLGLGFPLLVDTLDDRVGSRYSGMPSRLYVIDRDGKVAYQSGRGPFGFKPREMEQSLLMVLSESAGESAVGE